MDQEDNPDHGTPRRIAVPAIARMQNDQIVDTRLTPSVIRADVMHAAVGGISPSNATWWEWAFS
jgi:hypothetical protein